MAYRVHGAVGKTHTARELLIFDDGNNIHDQLRPIIRRGLIRQGSCYRLRDLETKGGLAGLTGHVDGILHHKKSCPVETHLDRLVLEVKSAGAYAFEKMEKSSDKAADFDFSYRAQSSGYMRMIGVEGAIILMKNKNNSDLLEFFLPIDNDLLDNRLDVIATVRESKNPEEVAREHEPARDGTLPWQCQYCPFWSQCWAAYKPQIGTRGKIRLQIPFTSVTNTQPLKVLDEKNGTEVAAKTGASG